MDCGFGKVASLQRPQSLDVAMCDAITDASLTSIASIPKLQHLDLSSCTLLTDAGLACVASVRTMHRLYLGSCTNITDAGLAACIGATPRMSTALLSQMLAFFHVKRAFGASPHCVSFAADLFTSYAIGSPRTPFT
jgi:hypothetical protein